MKVEVYNRLMDAQLSRRRMLKGAAGAGAIAAGMGSGLGGLMGSALAQSGVRADILKIPGVGVGSPTDSDWQKVGALCLEPTKANVAEGEFAGVELTFLGLNNQNPSTTSCSAAFSSRGRPIPAPRSTGSIWRRPTTMRGCSSRSPPAPSTSTSSRWARLSRATSAARAWLP